MRLLIFTIFTYFVRARKIVFPYTSRDLGEGCRVGFFEVARKGAYLSYVTAAGVPQTKVKYAPLYKVAYLKKSMIFCLITCNLPSMNCFISLFLDFLNCSRCLSMSSFCIT